jgi:hypothetical protein
MFGPDEGYTGTNAPILVVSFYGEAGVAGTIFEDASRAEDLACMLL